MRAGRGDAQATQFDLGFAAHLRRNQYGFSYNLGQFEPDCYCAPLKTGGLARISAAIRPATPAIAP